MMQTRINNKDRWDWGKVISKICILFKLIIGRRNQVLQEIFKFYADSDCFFYKVPNIQLGVIFCKYPSSWNLLPAEYKVMILKLLILLELYANQ